MKKFFSRKLVMTIVMLIVNLVAKHNGVEIPEEVNYTGIAYLAAQGLADYAEAKKK